MTSDAATPPASLDLNVLLASGRPAVQGFFSSLGEQMPGLVVTTTALTLSELDEALAGGPAPALAVIDIAVEPGTGIELCRELRARRPLLPIAALLCCPQAVDPWQLQSLFTTGVTSLFDLQASPEEAVRLLASAARGAAVLHIHLRRSHRTLLRDLFLDHGRQSDARLRLLKLVACGLPDHEIGRRLHLSPHTVKHHIENLRADLGVRNRTELAAWAGRHGFYPPDAGQPVEIVPVAIARPRRALSS